MKALRLLIILIILPSLSHSQEIIIHHDFLDEDRGLRFQLASDNHTHDSIFGNSFRLFLVKKEGTEGLLRKVYLPLNLSPDFPYDLNTDFYKRHKLLIIQGVSSCFLYYPEKDFLSVQLVPDQSECSISDMQGTYIRSIRLSNDGSMLEIRIMECKDPFRYDISNPDQIKAVLPPLSGN